MKILFIAYENIKVEARTQEVYSSLVKVHPDTVFASWSNPSDDQEINNIILNSGKKKYFRFIFNSIRTILKHQPNVVVLHDNYTSVILWWLIKFKKNIHVIYDSSELYIDRKPKTLKGKIASHMYYFEKKYIKYADLVMAANIERAEIMKDYFSLPELPLVFDNIHRIDDEIDFDKCDKKYGHLFNKDQFSVIYAGGIAEKRRTFDLMSAVNELGMDYQLIILGNIAPQDKERYDKWMSVTKKHDNISYLGFVSRAEWRYLLMNSHISVSAFSQDTVNNKFCASGKLYESIFEYKPILTSTNPPLKRVVADEKVGVSTDNFVEGILDCRENYEFYLENVKRYANSIDYEGRIDSLASQLRENISQSTKIN